MTKSPQQVLPREVGKSAFGLDAEGYHLARLPYPEELYDELFCRLPKCASVLEIGAGTGLATEALLSRNVSAVTAVEPDPTLATFIEQRLADTRLKMIRGSFPNAAITGEFDLIACAAAFHWLEPKSALESIKALLSRQGFWAMWWHSYRNPGMGDPLADEISLLLDDIALPPSDTLGRHYSLDQEMHRRLLEDAGFRSIECRIYRSERRLTAESVVALYQSYSFVRVLPCDRRKRLLEDLARLVDTKFGGSAPNLVITPLYIAYA